METFWGLKKAQKAAKKAKYSILDLFEAPRDPQWISKE